MKQFFIFCCLSISCVAMEIDPKKLKAAIFSNNVKKVKKNLVNFQDISKTQEFCTDEDPYGVAIITGNPAIVQLFIHQGYSVEQQMRCLSALGSPRFQTPLIYAQANKQKKLIKLFRLYQKLKKSVVNNQPKKIRSLLNSKKKKLCINARYEDYRTLLHVACLHNKMKSVQTLLKAGIEVNLHDLYNYTAFYLALSNNPVSFESAKILLESGADVDDAYERAEEENDTNAQNVLTQLAPKKVSFIHKN